MNKFIFKQYKNVLVTGGAGAIGSRLVKRLLDFNIQKIIVIDNLTSGFRGNLPRDKRIYFIKGDIAKNGDLQECFKYQIDLIFHLAASFANQRSIDYPLADLKTNGEGALKLLEFSVKNKVKKFIYFSSSCVYGNKNTPMREDDLNLDPETPYAITKLLGEYYTKFYYRFYGLPMVILRIFNSYGPGERAGKYRNVIPNFFQKAINGESLTITGTGKEKRAFTFVEDIVEQAILASIKAKAVGRVLNIGNQKEVTIEDLAQMINLITKNKSPIKFLPPRKWDTIERRIPNLVLNKKILSRQNKTSIYNGLLQTYKWFIKEKIV